MSTDFTRNILVIKLGALGDFVQALGPMAAIRQQHPKDHITLLTTEPYEALATKCRYFNDVWIDKRPKWHQLSSWLKLRHKLNKREFARVYDLQNNDRTSFYFKLFAKDDKPEWVGIAKGASHRNTSSERTAGLAFDGHLQTLALAGITNINIDDLSWLKADSEFILPENYALIIPGCAPSRPEKRWPAAQFIALAKQLSDKNITPVIIGTAEEQDITSEIAKALDDKIVDLTGKTKLADISHLARKARVAIGNDTGPMHMIAPTGCPTIVLFSAHSTPHRHAPLGKNVTTLQENKIADISADDVMNVANSLI